MLSILPVRGVPEVRAGHDLAALVAARARLLDGDVVVVAQKVVSKAEGALAWPAPGEDRATARRRLAREQAVRVVADSPDALIVETRHGLVCANAGIDASNVPDGALLVLPEDPDGSARALRASLRRASGSDVAVVVADSFGRPWRTGMTDIAIGVAGLRPIRDERGSPDRQGAALEVTRTAVGLAPDEIRRGGQLVGDGVPVVVVRGFPYERDERAGADLLQRPPAEDLFRRGRGGVADALSGRAPAADAALDPRAPDRVDLDRVAAAARQVGGPGVQVSVGGGALFVTGGALDAGVAAGAAIAALADLGYAATRRAPQPGEQAATVVVRPGSNR